MPASTTIISSPKRSSVQFIPNSPMPPRGMISKTLDTYRCFSTLWTGFVSIARHVCDGRPARGSLAVKPASKQPHLYEIEWHVSVAPDFYSTGLHHPMRE